MTYTVVFTPEAHIHLAALYRYTAQAASPKVAQAYVDAIIRHCESFQTFPLRGTARDDIRLGLRITHYKKRTVIAFSVLKQTVAIIGIFYGGQDYASVLHEPLDGSDYTSE
jgi:toxin ParE1/3/4